LLDGYKGKKSKHQTGGEVPPTFQHLPRRARQSSGDGGWGGVATKIEITKQKIGRRRERVEPNDTEKRESGERIHPSTKRTWVGTEPWGGGKALNRCEILSKRKELSEGTKKTHEKEHDTFRGESKVKKAATEDALAGYLVAKQIDNSWKRWTSFTQR